MVDVLSSLHSNLLTSCVRGNNKCIVAITMWLRHSQHWVMKNFPEPAIWSLIYKVYLFCFGLYLSKGVCSAILNVCALSTFCKHLHTNTRALPHCTSFFSASGNTDSFTCSLRSCPVPALYVYRLWDFSIMLMLHAFDLLDWPQKERRMLLKNCIPPAFP